jgi:uncharacterized membrane protein YfcA
MSLSADPVFYATAVSAVLIVGVAKGGFGGGIGIVGVPLMALSVGPLRAAAIMLPILMVMDAFALRAWWRRWDGALLSSLIPGAVAGTLLGWATFRYFSADALRILVGLLAMGHAANAFVARNAPAARSRSAFRAAFWSTASGFTSFGIHAGGPPLQAYLLPLRLDKSAFQATTVAFFFGLNWLKLGPYALLGQLDGSNLLASALLAPLAPLGIRLGAWLHHRIDEAAFYRVVYVSLFAIGAKLVYDGAF